MLSFFEVSRKPPKQKPKPPVALSLSIASKKLSFISLLTPVSYSEDGVRNKGYYVDCSIKLTKRTLREKYKSGKMNRTMLHIRKNMQWIPVALIACLVVVAVGAEIMGSPSAPSPAPLTANFSYVPSSNIIAGEALTFDAALSGSSNGPVTDYTWDFGDGSPFAYGKVATHVYTTEGIFTVTLTIESARGYIDSRQETVDVSPKPQLPMTIEFTISPNPALVNTVSENQLWINKSLTFSASASNLPSGFSANYSWSFGDGATGTGAVVSHAYQQEGNYSVTLTALDPEGDVLSTTQQVQILPIPAARIYVDPLPITINQSQIGQTITMNVMISNVTDLYTWTAGMTFNQTVFKCIYVTAPDNSAANGTPASGEMSLLPPGGYTLWVAPMTTEGVEPYLGWNLTGATTLGVSGSGILATVEFLVIGAGVSSIHLTNVMLFDSKGTVIPVFVEN
jgi:PKD repeat protein